MRRCPICKTKYKPIKPMQSCCLSPDCAIEKGRQNKAKRERIEAKQERKTDLARKEKLKTPSDRAKPAQAAVNRYINARDRGKPCISCGKPDIGVRNASHYKTRGSNSALRFNLWNIHSACYSCNCMKGGNIAGYIPGLIARIGIVKVEWLNCKARSREYTDEYYKRITRIFNKKTKRQLKRANDPHQ